MPESTPGYTAIRHGSAYLDPHREVVRAAGADATAFLQGQLSQDLLGVAPGGSVWSWLLQPAGKVEALVRASRKADDEWLIDTDAGWGEAVATRLSRFKLRTKVDIEVAADLRLLGLRGPGVERTGGDHGPGTAMAVEAGWPGLPGVDLVGPDPRPPEGAVGATDDDWQAARVEAGIPVMGAELTERTIPAETGLVELTVSFTKGCYTGQELVARIDSRGSHVPRRLRGVLLEGPAEPGSPLTTPEGADAGVLTSVARSPQLGWVALGYVRRAVNPGDPVLAGDSAGRVAELPLVGP